MAWAMVAWILSSTLISSNANVPLTARDLGPRWHQVSQSRVDDRAAKPACSGLKIPALGTVQLTRFASGTGAANVDVYVSKPSMPTATFNELRAVYRRCTLHVTLAGKHGVVTGALNSRTGATHYGRIGKASFGSQISVPSPQGPAYYVQEFMQVDRAIAEVIYTAVVPPGQLVKNASSRVTSRLGGS
jgi:hypothetical protein